MTRLFGVTVFDHSVGLDYGNKNRNKKIHRCSACGRKISKVTHIFNMGKCDDCIIKGKR